MKRLLLVDGHSLIHRAYHAFPPTLSTASGEKTNAVYGFTRILLETLEKLEPTHVAVAFDLPGPTFRETMFVGYKRSRVKPDDDMIAQIPRVKEVVQALNIPIFEVPGYEADDVIGTLTKQAVGQTRLGDTLSRVARQPAGNVSAFHSSSLNDRPSRSTFDHSSYGKAGDQFPRKVSPSRVSRDTQVVILTSDRDLMQLIRDDSTLVELPERKKKFRQSPVASRQSLSDLWGEKRFVDTWGFTPELLPDFKAFAGDQSDDIPGVRGIGEKTAKELISQFGSVNEVYRVITQKSNVKSQNDNSKLKSFSKRIIRQLAEDQESAQMSKQLATIDTNVPIALNWDATAVHDYDKEKTTRLFEELQFKSLIPKLPNDSFEESVQETLF